MSTTLSFPSADELAREIRELDTDLLIVISDEQVRRLHGSLIPTVDRSGHERKILHWDSPRGEDGKTFRNFELCLESLLSRGVHRRAHLLALGGGSVSDFAGFVASSLLRGISWSALPTTLLSMVDASIGGKVGINSMHGKNLIGAFHRPDRIRILPEFLTTLDPLQMQSGRGEILKCGFLDPGIHRQILGSAPLPELIGACARFKLRVTEQDFHETELRRHLNLGHTLGHAFEILLHLPHGIAVARGIQFVLNHFLDAPDLVEQFRLLADHLELGEEMEKPLPPMDPDALLRLIFRDKKSISTGSLELVLLDDIGAPRVVPTPFDVIARTVREQIQCSV